ncbi:MAG: hypothetical protein JXC33_10730 [Deltaproteobacteria bacterium]|nr:hypothetical protein [Deltaproteobacteria bacterium]
MKRRRKDPICFVLVCVLTVVSMVLILHVGPVLAKRTITGRVTIVTGQPASGYLVKAWDEDSGGKNDFMGQAYTNAQGYYKIGPFTAKHWDPAPHNVTTWRPDIFVEVYAKIGGKWVPVKQSKTYKDRKHKDDTTINVQLTGIEGIITDSRKKPVAGILVRAWDSDDVLGGKHDFLNEVVTDSKGHYFMMYEGKHWDPAPHGVTTWRPDIFVKVLRKVHRYGYVKVGESRTYNDWPHAKHLTINVSIPEEGWSGWKRTAFERAKHGWPFKNVARLVCAAPTCKDENPLGKIGKATRFRWALCGGMCLSALNRFRDGKTNPPNFSPTIKKELVDAQIATLVPYPCNWTRFVKWTMKPNKSHTVALHTIGHSTKEEWPKLRKAIDRQAPIIMGMIFAGPSNLANDVSSNHQVLATGYRYNNGTKEVEIEVYDPNYLQTCTIAMNIGIPGNQLMAQETTPDCTRNFRGFFVIDKGSGPPHKSSVGGSGTSRQIPIRRR